MLVREAVVYVALLIRKRGGLLVAKGLHEAFCEKPHCAIRIKVQATSPYIPVTIFLAICGDKPVINPCPA